MIPYTLTPKTLQTSKSDVFEMFARACALHLPPRLGGVGRGAAWACLLTYNPYKPFQPYLHTSNPHSLTSLSTLLTSTIWGTY